MKISQKFSNRKFSVAAIKEAKELFFQLVPTRAQSSG
jgi:hypothetical protein